MSDRCDQQINAAAWVLGALDESEVPAYGTHVESCHHCQAEIAHLMMVSDALPLAVDQIAPAPELGDRIMAVVSSEAQLLRAAGPEADRPAAPQHSAKRRWSWLSGWRLVPAGAAALGVGLIVGIALSGGSGTSTRVEQAKVTIPGAHAQLVVNGTRASLHLTGMPNPPDGKVYEVWVQRDSKGQPLPTTALFTVRSDGAGDVMVPKPVHPGDSVLVTAEQSGGADKPTSSPVIAAQA